MRFNRFLLGLDPGFSNIGYSVVGLGPNRLTGVVAAGVIRTAKSKTKGKDKVSASVDNVRRATEIASRLDILVKSNAVAAICVEAMSFPRSASVAAKMAMCWGVVTALALQYGAPIIQASPQEIKKALCRTNSASKGEVEEAVKRSYDYIDTLLSTVPRSYREHAYDATGAVMACLDSTVLNSVRNSVA